MNKILLYSSYFFWLFIPSFMYVSFGGGLSQGSIVAVLLQICLFVVFKSSQKININRVMLLNFLFFTLIVINYILPEYSIVGTRQVGLFVFIVFAILCAEMFVVELKYLGASELIIFFERLVIILITWTLMFYFISFPFSNYGNFPKQMFPYAEPSHYVLSCGFMLFVAGTVVSFKYRVASLCLLLFVAVFMPSLVALVLSCFYLIHFKSLFTIRGFLLGVLLGMLILLGTYHLLGVRGDINKAGYYLDRIDFSSDNNNLTALVYMQGYHLIFYNLKEYPLGLGIQNLGKEPPVDISLLIYHLTGEFKNRTDGGFLASKFISEFGFLGFCIVIIYLFHWFQLLFKFIFRREHYNKLQLIYMAGYLVFFVELFMRGTGYFSFGTLLLFLYLINIRRTSLSN